MVVYRQLGICLDHYVAFQYLEGRRIASLFYYLRWICPAVSLAATAPSLKTPADSATTGAYVAAGAALLLGLIAEFVLDLFGGKLLG